MQSAITELWNGGNAYCENCGVGDYEIENLMMILERSRETLCEILDERQRQQFRKHIDGMERLTALLAEQAFRDGFCLASRLTCEALLGE